jgi:hypothetical protein
LRCLGRLISITSVESRRSTSTGSDESGADIGAYPAAAPAAGRARGVCVPQDTH